MHTRRWFTASHLKKNLKTHQHKTIHAAYRYILLSDLFPERTIIQVLALSLSLSLSPSLCLSDSPKKKKNLNVRG